MYDLINVFDIFLPQLLMYPNPEDPLNPDAAALLLREPDVYKKKVEDYVIKYAKGTNPPGQKPIKKLKKDTTRVMNQLGLLPFGITTK